MRPLCIARIFPHPEHFAFASATEHRDDLSALACVGPLVIAGASTRSAPEVSSGGGRSGNLIVPFIRGEAWRCASAKRSSRSLRMSSILPIDGVDPKYRAASPLRALGRPGAPRRPGPARRPKSTKVDLQVHHVDLGRPQCRYLRTPRRTIAFPDVPFDAMAGAGAAVRWSSHACRITRGIAIPRDGGVAERTTVARPAQGGAATRKKRASSENKERRGKGTHGGDFDRRCPGKPSSVRCRRKRRAAKVTPVASQSSKRAQLVVRQKLCGRLWREQCPDLT